MIDISDGIALFNECNFFEAHDFFEDIWMEANRDEKEFFQGMVQISVGFYHLICGNKKGAESQLLKGLTKLRKFEPEFYKIDLISLNSNIDRITSTIKSDKDILKRIPTINLITKPY